MRIVYQLVFISVCTFANIWGVGICTAREETVFREDRYGVYEEDGDCGGGFCVSYLILSGRVIETIDAQAYVQRNAS